MKWTLLVILVSGLAGAGFVFAGLGQLLSPLTQTASNLFQQAQTLYTGIASNPLFTPILTLSTAVGIPLIVMYARSYLAKKEVQHQAELAKMSSDAYVTVGTVQSQAQQVISQKDQTIQQLTAKLADQSDVQTLQAKIDQQVQELQHLRSEYNTMERTYQSMVEELKLKERVIVK